MKSFYKIFFLSFIFPLGVKANCDFKTGEYISELSKPNKINEIIIKIPNSRKYSKDLLAYHLDGFRPNKKIKHKAIFNIKYEFGNCISEGKVWQNGDAIDHIKNYTRSLNGRLDNGNIFNATKFKLLIPESRNGNNEILGTLILKELDIISPETFEVPVKVNGNSSIMLFQEDSRKELLERNRRREGPIFEGDESLYWGNGKYRPGLLENISLSRLINKNWFLKNKSAEVISLNAFFNLQNAYLKYASYPGVNVGTIIFPNMSKNDHFIDYYFLMTAMNGVHGLRPHNRKYYYNSINQSFEPIYYDGNFDLIKNNDYEKTLTPEKVIKKVFYNDYKYKNLSRLSSSDFQKKIIGDFKNRVIDLKEDDIIWIKSRLKSISNNANILQELINNIHKNEYISKNFNYPMYRKRYLDALKAHDFKQNNINKISRINNEYLINNNFKISNLEMSKIISRNKFNKKRYVFIPEDYENKVNKNLKKFNLPAYKFDAKVYFSDGIKIYINKFKKEIIISQENPNDWVLFKNSKIGNWHIKFKGVEPNKNIILDSRFNEIGLTGCLNFYKTVFKNTRISTDDGQCEDSLNLIKSKGNINNIEINNGFADAIDIDFSNIYINYIKVNNSKNDCIDFSLGKYNINYANLKKCGDKGISIGENSYFKINNLEINKSLIGLSVKDLSLAEVNQAFIYNSNICVESKQKKQEFGGSKIILKSIKCPGQFFKDENSVIKIYNYDI